MAQIEPLLEMKGITKTFPGVVALAGARLSVVRGEVHALVGENGAGKSTLIKILTGAYRRDSGRVTFGGHEVDFVSPQQAQAFGISTIYQEINLVPFRSVAENIFMGREPRRFGLINWSRMNGEATKILSDIGVSVDVSEPLLNFDIAIRQMVAIARAVSFSTRLVVMDEPTSSLDEYETATLFELIRRLKADGVSVIFITHRLDELYAVCDRVTIMRDGKTVDEQHISQISKLELVAKMLGKDLVEVQRSGQLSFGVSRYGTEPPLLQADGLHRGLALKGASIRVRAGEIVGLAGLLGSGRTETARAIFGADELTAGDVKLEGQLVRFQSPADAISAGIGFCSEDRKADGVIPYLSVRENLTLAALPMLSRNGIVAADKQQEIVDRFIKLMGIKTTGPEQKIRELSGGNQQKVLLARWLCLGPKLLILDEPTRGIDVGAKGEIQRLINELADQGVGVLMISSELEELTEGTHRVVVMRDRRTVAEFDRAEINPDVIMAAIANSVSDYLLSTDGAHG